MPEGNPIKPVQHAAEEEFEEIVGGESSPVELRVEYQEEEPMNRMFNNEYFPRLQISARYEGGYKEGGRFKQMYISTKDDSGNRKNLLMCRYPMNSRPFSETENEFNLDPTLVTLDDAKRAAGIAYILAKRLAGKLPLSTEYMGNLGRGDRRLDISLSNEEISEELDKYSRLYHDTENPDDEFNQENVTAKAFRVYLDRLSAVTSHLDALMKQEPGRFPHTTIANKNF